jgi:hypothetical protein
VVVSGARSSLTVAGAVTVLAPIWVVRTVFPFNPLDSIHGGTFDSGNIAPGLNCVKSFVP